MWDLCSNKDDLKHPVSDVSPEKKNRMTAAQSIIRIATAHHGTDYARLSRSERDKIKLIARDRFACGVIFLHAQSQ